MPQNGRPARGDEHTINPYQWIEARRGTGGERHDALGESWDTARHDTHRAGRLSGRLICRLRAHAPIAVGATLEPKEDGQADQPGRIRPYRVPIGTGDDPSAKTFAIPGSTLKGLLSSTAEAISGSALRVLENSPLSERRTVEESISKIGQVRRRADGSLEIVPIGNFPGPNDSVASAPKHLPLADHVDPHGRLYYSVGVTQGAGRAGAYWVKPPRGDVLGRKIRSEALESFASLLMERIAANAGESWRDCPDKPPYVPLGYLGPDAPVYCSKRKPAERQVAFVSGLCSWLPGKLILYELEGNEVTMLSFSAVWRRRFAAPTVHELFPKDVLPWGSADRERGEELSPAEALFGVIEDAPGDEEKSRQARLLAGRVRVSDALPAKPIVSRGEVKLRALSSPKPPSPSMYIKRNKAPAGEGGHGVSRRERKALGRKRYVPQKPEEQWRAPQTVHGQPAPPADRQLVVCEPIHKGAELYFHVDVQNLSKAELELIITALAPVAGDDGQVYRHTIGLGKPIGLGAASIEVLGFWERDVQAPVSSQRLRESIHVRRSRLAGSEAKTEAKAGTMPKRYALEDDLPVAPGSLTLEPDESLIDKELLARLKVIGNPANTDPANTQAAVWYPVVRDARTEHPVADAEGFNWFGKNREPGPEQALDDFDGAELARLEIYDS